MIPFLTYLSYAYFYRLDQTTGLCQIVSVPSSCFFISKKIERNGLLLAEWKSWLVSRLDERKVRIKDGVLCTHSFRHWRGGQATDAQHKQDSLHDDESASQEAGESVPGPRGDHGVVVLRSPNVCSSLPSRITVVSRHSELLSDCL